MDGIYLIDKETDWTSFDVVAKMRGLTGIKKIGHAGTLDPFATGLLIVLVGKEATKRQDEFLKQDKEYEATLELGKTSTTGDTEGVITSRHSGLDPESALSDKEDSCFRRNDEMKIEEISGVLNNFIGEIQQIPPVYSAIKINGKKAYELARKGQQVELKPRKVRINNISLIEYSWPYLRLKVSCGSGTYIRSLATDIGEALGTGAYLTGLRRTSIGEFSVNDAKKIGELTFLQD